MKVNLQIDDVSPDTAKVLAILATLLEEEEGNFVDVCDAVQSVCISASEVMRDILDDLPNEPPDGQVRTALKAFRTLRHEISQVVSSVLLNLVGSDAKQE